MKTVRKHKCTRNHRTYRTFVECQFPRTAWIKGEGPYLLLARCDVWTITLWTDLTDALREKELIDYAGCGHACNRDHQIFYVDMSL